MFAQSWELSWWPGLSSSRVLWVSRGEDWRGCPEVRGPERPPTASIWYRCPAQEVEAQRRFPVTSCGVSCCVQSVECVAACLLTSESTDAARVLIQKWSWHQCWGLSGFSGTGLWTSTYQEIPPSLRSRALSLMEFQEPAVMRAFSVPTHTIEDNKPGREADVGTGRDHEL